MAELRSFLIGVAVAGVLLAVVAVMAGVFGGDESPTTSARLIEGTAASPTPSSVPDVGTTALPTLAPTTQPAPTPADEPSAEPTEEPTNTPEPEPTADPVNLYLAIIQPIVGDLDANIAYVIGQSSANPSGSTQAASAIQGLASRMNAASPPACLSGAHATLVQAANEASAAAGQLISALEASNSGLVQAALGAMETARGTLGTGAAQVSSASC